MKTIVPVMPSFDLSVFPDNLIEPSRKFLEWLPKARADIGLVALVRKFCKKQGMDKDTTKSMLVWWRLSMPCKYGWLDRHFVMTSGYINALRDAIVSKDADGIAFWKGTIKAYRKGTRNSMRRAA